MHDVHEFLRSLTIVLAVAAVTTVLFQRLRQPVVLGYLIAGLIVGPHVPIPLVADRDVVHTLSELGVILLMFSLGLEFSLAKLMRVGPTATVTAAIQCSVMFWLGYLGGQLFGWTVLESIFAGAVIAISSTTIIAKVFDEQGIGGRLRELVVGVLLVEDLIAILFMAALTAIATGAGLSAGALAATVGRLAAFLVVLLAVGMLVIPRLIRLVVGLGRAETTLVASIGICFVIAYVAQTFGYSIALGAFLAGSLIAESGRGEEIEHLVRPVRDLFAAIFFVSVGMLIDPGLAIQHWQAVVVFTVLVVAGKITSVAVGAFLTGEGIRTAVQAGMSLAQIGEFSFIIASLGVALGVTRDFLYTIAVAVSAITTLTTPWLIRAAIPVAAYTDRKLPHRLQTLTALYGTWLERLRARSAAAPSTGVARFVRLLVVDGLVLSALVVAVGVWLGAAAAALERTLGVEEEVARMLIIAAAGACSLPLIVGVGRQSRRLGITLAATALPHAIGRVDLDAAPRRALVLTVQLGIAVGVAAVVLAITQPFLPSYAGPLIFVAMVGGFTIAIWRSAVELEGHVRAGAQAIVEALTTTRAEPVSATAFVEGRSRGKSTARSVRPIAAVAELLPGLGVPIAVELDGDSPCVGRSLAELNLRGRTGATVLAIIRPDAPVLAPTAGERLRSGDVLALTGTRDAVDAAKDLLLG